jgi:hypothetical protein
MFLFGKSNAVKVSDCSIGTTTEHRIIDPLIRAWHSTLPNPPPGWRVAFLVYASNLAPVAVATWGRPIARMEDQECTLELTRLAHSLDAPYNLGSWALARMRKWIRENMPEIERVISYQNADKHLGTIYKADNWHKVYEKFTEHTWTNRVGRKGTEATHKIKWEREP